MGGCLPAQRCTGKVPGKPELRLLVRPDGGFRFLRGGPGVKQVIGDGVPGIVDGGEEEQQGRPRNSEGDSCK